MEDRPPLPFEDNIATAVDYLRLAIETFSAVVVAVGVVAALWALYRGVRHHEPANFTRVRMMLARYLTLALEFQLAADVLSTAISPSWEQIGRLAAIAVIRTGLNYFLMKEMEHEKDEIEHAMHARGKEGAQSDDPSADVTD
jgi:uncharacterized membrane protein